MLGVGVKRILPAPLATGTICLTMYLTNQNKSLLGSMELLKIEDKPQIEEKEILQQTIQQQPPPPPPPSSDGSGKGSIPGSPDPSQGDQKEPNADSQETQDNGDQSQTEENTPSVTTLPSENGEESDEDTDSQPNEVSIPLEELAVQLFREINTKYPRGKDDYYGFLNVYEMTTRISRLNEVLTKLRDQKQAS